MLAGICERTTAIAPSIHHEDQDIFEGNSVRHRDQLGRCREDLHLKEKLVYIALDFDTEMTEAGKSSDKEKTCELPDGNIITVASERFHGLGKEASGIQDTIFQSIMNCDADVLEDLNSNVMLVGGTIVFSGIGERSTKELTPFAPSTMKIKVWFFKGELSLIIVVTGFCDEVQSKRCVLIPNKYGSVSEEKYSALTLRAHSTSRHSCACLS